MKLWTTNEKDDLREAIELFKSGKIDFLELYIVPDSFGLAELEILREIPTIIHSPHCEHNFNVFELASSQIELFKTQVVKTADFLNSQFIIVHSGVGQSPEAFKKNIDMLFDKRILIENMPKVALDDRICFGCTLEQLEFIKKECGFDICLDFGHAIKSAVSQGLAYKEFVKTLASKLNPFYFHISGGDTNNEKDKHLDLFEGDIDIKWISNTLAGLKKDIYLVFETPKKEGLKNYLKNIDYFKRLLT